MSDDFRLNRDQQPTAEAVSAYTANPLWDKLCQWIEQAYQVKPAIEYSVCSGEPGWNVKYKKSGRALCTLYPAPGGFTALVVVGAKEQNAVELLLPTLSPSLAALYQNAAGISGARWLMINVNDERLLADVKELIHIRVRPKAAVKQQKQ